MQLAVSTVMVMLRERADGLPALRLPLVRRIREPFEGLWALPGGPLLADEALEASAARNLRETTGLRAGYLEQLYAFGTLDRSPGPRVVSVVYWALVPSTDDDPDAGRRADDNVRWFDADDLPELAFDHRLVVDYALWRLRTKVEYSRIAHAVLGDTFTLAQLRRVHEAILGRRLDAANFRRTILASGAVVATGEVLADTSHRPPGLYRYIGTGDFADNGPLARLDTASGAPQADTAVTKEQT